MKKRSFLNLCLAAAAARGASVFASATGASRLYFNHATIYVTPATYRAIVSNAFLRNEFVNFEEKTTVRDGGRTRYTGAYLYGARTYLEFCEASSPAELGQVEPGFWMNRQSDLESLLNPLKKLPGAHPVVEQATIPLGGVEVPWFKDIDIAWDPVPADLKVLPWVMSVFPGYLKAKYPDLTPDEDGETREKQNARRFDRSRLFADISQFTVTTNTHEAQMLAATLAAFGLPSATRGDGQSFDADDVNIIVRDAPAAGRSVSWRLRLNRPVPRQTIVLGDSALTLDGSGAEWLFTG